MTTPIYAIVVSSSPIPNSVEVEYWTLAHEGNWIHPEWDGAKISDHRHDPEIELNPALKQWCDQRDAQGQMKNIVIPIFKQSTTRHKEYMHWMARSLTVQCKAYIKIKEI